MVMNTIKVAKPQSQLLFRSIPDNIPHQKWPRSRSLVHSILENVVCNNNLLWDIKMLTGYQHTRALEVFYSLLLKYCPKRQHFSYKGMQACIELAIYDHNYNTKRKQTKTKKDM